MIIKMSIHHAILIFVYHNEVIIAIHNSTEVLTISQCDVERAYRRRYLLKRAWKRDEHFSSIRRIR